MATADIMQPVPHHNLGTVVCLCQIWIEYPKGIHPIRGIKWKRGTENGRFQAKPVTFENE